MWGNAAISSFFFSSGAYLIYAMFASSDIPERPILWEVLMSVTNIFIGGFGTAAFIMDKYL